MNKPAKNFSAHKIFSSHMVLQRERPIVISGIADPGTEVQVGFAGNTRTATADANSEWSVTFPAMAAGGPHTMEIRGADDVQPQVFDDILIGEVWMCSGQSNMEMPVYGGGEFWCTTNYKEEIANADHPRIRLYNSFLMRRMSPDYPLPDENGPGWQVCTPKTVELFSACGYFFGRKLMQDLDVPVGLVSTAWGGTDIQAWISKEAFEKNRAKLALAGMQNPSPEFFAELKKIWAGQVAAIRPWLKKFFACGSAVAEEAKKWTAPEFDDSAWEKTGLPFIIPFVGVAVVRGTFEIPAELAGKDITLHLGAMNDCDETWFNGEKIGETTIDQPNYWSSPRNYTVPGRLVKAGRNTLAVRIANHFSQGGWTTPEVTFSIPDTKVPRVIHADWRQKTEFVADPREIGVRPEINGGASIRDRTSPNYPTTLFNGMLHPWFRYQFRGVIWYQGCNNNGQASYYPYHKILIQDWRDHWKNPEMPFLLVQLSAFASHCPDNRGDEDAWKSADISAIAPYALTREIQAEMPHVMKNTGMAVSFDAGDQYDIHPRNKQVLGYRLALEAERIAYGKDVISQGPRFREFRAEGAKARVFFDHAEGLKTSDGAAPDAFAISGDGVRYFPAAAEIDSDTVVLSAPEVTTAPKGVRYAFVGYHPHANLQNGAGLPAEPFRSDKPDWEKTDISF